MRPATIEVFRSFRAPVLDLWPYLTRPDRLAQWLGAADVEMALGGELTASLWNGDVLRGELLAFAPPNQLDINWRSPCPNPAGRVHLRIERLGPGSRVHVSHENLQSDEERRQAAAWWQQALGALHTAVDGKQDAHQWGDALAIVCRAPLGRTAEDVWPLLSTSRGFEKWLARADRFDAEAGGGFRFVSRYKGAEVVEEGRIEAIDPGRYVALSWQWVGQGWEADTRVELLLEPDAGGVALLISHSGFEALNPESRILARRNYAAAWPEVIGDLRRLVAPG